METINNYPLDNFYSYIKTNKRISALGNSAEKTIIYGKTGDKMSGKISSFDIDTNNLNSRLYGIIPNVMELEKNIHFVDSTLYQLTKITVTNFIKSKSNSDILFNLRDTTDPVNIFTLEKSALETETTITGETINKWNVNFNNHNNTQRVKLNINKSIELGKSEKETQLIKIINNTGNNLSIGSSDDNNIKIEFTNSYNLNNRTKLNKINNINYIDYDIYDGDGNNIISPSEEISNLWLLGSRIEVNGKIEYKNNKYWTVDSSWLSTNQNNIEYLIKPRPTFKYIHIYNGQISPTPLDYYRGVEPRGYNGALEISNTQVLSNMSYSFEDGSQYHLISQNTGGEIDYQNNKYIIKYPNGYKEALTAENGLNVGDVLPDSGGLLNLIKKGTKITFVETKNDQIKITPVTITDGQITEAIVECNEIIFD